MIRCILVSGPHSYLVALFGCTVPRNGSLVEVGLALMKSYPEMGLIIRLNPRMGILW